MHCKLILIVAAVLLLGSDMVAADDEPPVAVGGGTVRWITAHPAGAPVRIRVRGTALAELSVAGDNWHVLCADREVPAALLAPMASTVEEYDLPLAWQTDPGTNELTAVIDRGEIPAELTHLRVYFAAPEVLGVLRLEASDDDNTYTPAGGPLVVCQRLGNGVLRLTDCPVSAGDRRFIKLKMQNSDGVQVDKVTGWSAPDNAPAMYEVNASLGPMRDGTIDGEHLWPLLLEQNAVPLAKLKVLADAPGVLRRMRVVRLSATGQPVGTVASTVWADTLTTTGANPLERSEKWIDLPAGDITGEGWAIIVEDGDEPALQLSGVVAYAAEVELYLTMPDEAGPLELWLEPGLEPHLGLNAAGGPDQPAGEIAELDLTRELLSPAHLTPAPQWQTELQVVWGNWGKVALYGLGALIALILALALFRPRTPDGEAG